MQRVSAYILMPLAVAVLADGLVRSGRGQPPPLYPEDLRTAQQLALALDDRLAASSHRAHAAVIDATRAEAERLPTVALRGGYELRSDEQAFDFTGSGVPLADPRFPFRQRESLALAARARVPLYTSGRISSSIAAADATAKSASLVREATRLDVVAAAGEAFVDVLRQQRILAVRDASVRTLTRHAHDVRMAYEQGMATRNELLTANVRLSAAQQSLLQAEHAEDLAWSEYNRWLRRPLEFRAVLQDPDVPLAPQALADLVGTAHLNRPEAVESTVQAQGFRHEAEAHRRRALPQIYGQGGIVFEENRYQAPEEIGYVGVVVDWDLWDGGASSHRHAAARERALAAQRRQREMVGLIELEVRRAWLELTEALSRLEATRTDIAQAEENLRVVQQLFHQGMARSSDVLEAETIRSESSLRHFNAGYDAVLARIKLDRAVGAGLH